MTKYRITSPGTALAEEWRDSSTDVDTLVSARTGLAAGELEAHRRRVAVDPIVLRLDGARWRSRAVYDYRGPSAVARVAEMILVDENQYEDH